MRAVVDASAVLAFLNEEPGADQVEAALRAGALLSALNLAEVLARVAEVGADPASVADTVMQKFAVTVVPFEERDALDTAKLRLRTRSAGLSLADRACLALALATGLPVYTSDRAWRPIATSLGIELVLIR